MKKKASGRIRRRPGIVAVLALAWLAWFAASPVPALAQGSATRRVAIAGTGISLAVPDGVSVSKEPPADPKKPTLAVTVEDIRRFPAEGVVTRTEVKDQRAALEKGKAVVADAVGEEELARLVPLPIGASAVVYPNFSSFEVCDLHVEMRAVFFVGERRVTLAYAVPPADVIRENPAFFGKNKANCGAAVVWKNPGPELFRRFLDAAAAGKLGPAANAWQADFQAMLASLRRD